MPAVQHDPTKSPATPQRRAPRNTTNDSDSTAYRRQDGYSAPTAVDRAEAAVLAEAKRYGYRLAVRCVNCGHWLVAERSIADHVGPVCRRRVTANG